MPHTPSARRPAPLLARLLASAASLALLAASGAALAQGTQVGTAAAVNPRSTGVGASGTRTLKLGSDIIHRERIQTSGTGSVQVLFVDKTTLNIGPNSNLLIDEFVYDPAKKSGSMALSLTKGAVRFVGGNASHSGGAEVKTPVATIGIRGGVMGVTHLNGETRAVLQFGTMTVITIGGETIVVRRPGFMVIVGPNGATGPIRVSQQEIDALISRTRSVGQQDGGRPGPTPDMAGLSPNAGGPCSMPAQGQTTMDLSAVTCRYFNTDLQGIADSAAQQASQQGQDNVLIPLFEPRLPGEGNGEGPGTYPPPYEPPPTEQPPPNPPPTEPPPPPETPPYEPPPPPTYPPYEPPPPPTEPPPPEQCVPYCY